MGRSNLLWGLFSIRLIRTCHEWTCRFISGGWRINIFQSFPQFVTQGWPFFYLWVPQRSLISAAAKAVYGSGLWHPSSPLHPLLIELVPITLARPLQLDSALKTIPLDGCRRAGAAADVFSVPYGKCNYSNYCWEVALASGYGATYPWTGRELLLDTIRTNLQRINLFLSLFDLEVCHCC